jgi:hypothetical protein
LAPPEVLVHVGVALQVADSVRLMIDSVRLQMGMDRMLHQRAIEAKCTPDSKSARERSSVLHAAQSDDPTRRLQTSLQLLRAEVNHESNVWKILASHL